MAFTDQTIGKSFIATVLPNFLKLVGVLGVEPRTSSLSGTRSNQLSYTPIFYGGAEGARTLDILLAKQVL